MVMFWTWAGIAFCIVQSGIFSGLNLALFSVSRLRLEIAADSGNADAIKVRDLRRDSSLALSTIIWGNVGTNVVLTLLSNSMLAGIGAFAFSTLAITCLGEIIPQGYFSRHALRMTALLMPLLRIYSIILFPVTKPTAMFLNAWLGPEGIVMLRERDIRALIMRHVETGGEVGRLEGIGAQNFLDLDDITVADEGEPIDPRSVISLPIANNRPVVPKFQRSPEDPFLRQLNASGRKWVIITDAAGKPAFVLDAHHFLRDALFSDASPDLEVYWHRPIVVTDVNTRLGDVIGRMRVHPEAAGDDVIDNDLILIWGTQKRIITGADLLGRLLRGIAKIDEAADVARSA